MTTLKDRLKRVVIVFDASINVLRKIGMKQEGVLRQRARKWGVFEDVVCLAALAEDGAAV